MNKLIKCFKFQKIMFVIYLVMLVASFIFAMSFMTQYADLFGLESPLNEGIANFHDAMQVFNKQIFGLSAVGLISIVFMYLLETNKKVSDKLAIIVMSVFAIVSIALSVFGIMRIEQFMNQYKAIDFQYASFEDPALADYELKFETFYIGYGLYITLLVSSVSYILSLVLSHVLYLKVKKGEIENAK